MKNILLTLLITSAFSISACQEKMNKYDWKPTASAPADYPAQIFEGNFYYGKTGKIDVPDGRAINVGWGADGALNIAGEKMKEAPRTLEISWLSFAEGKNYSGKFELDTKKIEALLAAGYPDDTEPENRGSYKMINVGLAPGGDVVLWLSGSINKQVEIGHYKANAAGELDWKKVYPAMEGTIDTYISSVVSELPQEVQEQIKNKTIPFGYWEGLRKRYNWKPVFVSGQTVLRADLDYRNKEHDFIFGEGLKKIVSRADALPEEISVYWLDSRNRELRTEIKFNTAETAALFAGLSQEEGELIITIDAAQQTAAVKLKSKDKEVPFTQLKVQSFFR